jgi:hypothetical protein
VGEVGIGAKGLRRKGLGIFQKAVTEKEIVLQIFTAFAGHCRLCEKSAGISPGVAD